MLNVKRPWPVAARHTVGQMLPDVVFGCLHQVVAGGVPAEGYSSLWNPQIFGGGSLVDEIEEGTDANALAGIQHRDLPLRRRRRATRQGWAQRHILPVGRAHDTGGSDRERGSGGVLSPRVSWGSGGAGTWRGGLGQVIELGGAGSETPIALLCNFERVRNPARGRDGGHSGAAGGVALAVRRRIRPKGRQTVPPRDAIRLELPGGGGFGDPRRRDPQRVRDDVLDGLITVEDAKRDYGVVIANGTVDEVATRQARP